MSWAWTRFEPLPPTMLRWPRMRSRLDLTALRIIVRMDVCWTQFTQDTCNKRTDAYGGGIENRSRFGLEVARAVVDAVGGDRTGIRLSPFSTFQGMRMRDPIPQFSHLLHGAQGTRSGLHPRCGVQNCGAMPTSRAPRTSTLHWDIWGKASPVLLAGGFTPALAKRAVDEEYRDKDVAIVQRRWYTSNPDLPFRLKNDVELTKYNRDTFYPAKSKEGYIDYPCSKEFEKWSGR